MKKNEIVVMIQKLSDTLKQIEEECSMEISEIKLELLEIRKDIEALRNHRNFNPPQPICPTLPRPYVWTERDMKDIWDEIEEEMKKHGVYIGDWPDPSKTNCTTIICDKDENNPTQSK